MIEVEDIARVAHEANRAYCAALGDFTVPAWDQATLGHRESTIRGVQFSLQNADADTKAQHDAWVKDRLADGWVWGANKVVSLKTHPNLVPYDKLPPETRVKDRLFQSIVRTLGAMTSPTKESVTVVNNFTINTGAPLMTDEATHALRKQIEENAITAIQNIIAAMNRSGGDLYK